MKHYRFTTEKYQLRRAGGREILGEVMWFFISALSLAVSHASVPPEEARKPELPGSDLEQVLKDVTPLSLGVSPMRSSLPHPDEESLSGVSDALPPLDFPEPTRKKRSSRQ